MAKLALGTVQFGLDYGLTNVFGKPDATTVASILETAFDNGITVMDTANAYGSAENVLGENLPGDSSWAGIISKLPPLLDASQNELRVTSSTIAKAEAAITQTLHRLKRQKIDALMTHRASDLLCEGGEQLWAFMKHLQQAGKVGRIGVSVYFPKEADDLLSRYPLDIIQLPANLYDARFVKSGVLARLNAAGVQVHVRSLYLQGLLLTPPKKLQEQFAGIKEHHSRLFANIKDLGLTPIAACLAPYINLKGIDYLVIGCQNKTQLQELIGAEKFSKQIPRKVADNLRLKYALDNPKIINPSLWK